MNPSRSAWPSRPRSRGLRLFARCALCGSSARDALAREREALRDVRPWPQRDSVEPCGGELEGAIRAFAPAIDSVLIFDEERRRSSSCVAAERPARRVFCAALRCARERPAHAAGRWRSPPDTASTLARSRRARLSSRRRLRRCGAAASPASRRRERGLRGRAASRVDAADARGDRDRCADHAGFAYALAHEREADRAAGRVRRAHRPALAARLTRAAGAADRARAVRLRSRASRCCSSTPTALRDWNDTYGHASGDALLRALARRVARSGEQRRRSRGAQRRRRILPRLRRHREVAGRRASRGAARGRSSGSTSRICGRHATPRRRDHGQHRRRRLSGRRRDAERVCSNVPTRRCTTASVAAATPSRISAPDGTLDTCRKRLDD